MPKLLIDAEKLNWTQTESFDSITDKVDFLNDSIISLFDDHAPVRYVKIKHAPSPWMTDIIKSAMARRDRAFRKYKRNRSQDNWDAYKKLRNRCNQQIRNAKRRHISEQIELATPAGLWKFLRTLGLGKAKAPDTKISINLNLLNTFFSTSNKLSPQIKHETLINIPSIPLPNTAPFCFSSVSQDMIKKTMLSMKSKAVGNDNIGRVMLMYIIDVILPTITHIVNYSLLSSTFPAQWRQAHVIPLPKVSNPTLPNEFRPISILPFLSKLIESVTHKQITQYLLNENLFNSVQSGFRVGHSTTTALLKVTEDIRNAMEDSQVTILVLIDFSNAFNAVDHELLLAVLPRLNFSPSVVNWFSSYLQGRSQQVQNGEDSSDWCGVDAGVPQGGILSPLLFSIFINLLSPNLRCNYHFYADDLQLYYSTSPDNMSKAINFINADLLRLCRWSDSYGIKVNPNKCQAILVGSSRQLGKVDLSNSPSLLFNHCPIPFTPTVKDLGVIIDSNLKWNAQVQEISRKFYASLHSILRLKHFLPIKTKISLVNTLLLPIIFYADICFLDLTEDLLNKLDRLLNACIRFIFNLRKYDHVSEYRAKIKWLPIRERRNVRILCLLFTVLKDPYSPVYLKQMFQFRKDTHDRELRSSNSLTLAPLQHRSSFVDKSFAVVAVRLWNGLPDIIQKARDKVTFKRLVTELYKKQAYP